MIILSPGGLVSDSIKADFGPSFECFLRVFIVGRMVPFPVGGHIYNFEVAIGPVTGRK